MDATVLTIIGTLIATLISTGVATIVSFYLNRLKEIERFDLQLQNIVSISIEYPYLESREFAKTWSPELIKTDDRYQRYENYCGLVFNFLSEIAEWSNYKKEKIEAYIDIKNWLRIHEKCWKNPSLKHENVDVYDDKFKTIVNLYI
jgi:hypothetical protein